jgi:hypothetical protein
MSIIRDVTIDLGPREVVIDGKILGTAENISVDVAEATDEELAALKDNPVILLVKPLKIESEREAKHED